MNLDFTLILMALTYLGLNVQAVLQGPNVQFG